MSTQETNIIKVIQDDCTAAIYVNGTLVGQPDSFDDESTETILQALNVNYELETFDNSGYDTGFIEDFGLQGYPETWAEVEAAMVPIEDDDEDEDE